MKFVEKFDYYSNLTTIVYDFVYIKSYLSHRRTSLWITRLLQTQNLRVGQANEPCIGLIQENSIEFLSTRHLPYIQTTDGLCYTPLVLS